MGRLFSNRGANATKFIHDDEFGEVEIKRTRGLTLSLRSKTDGTMVASLPYFVSTKEVQKLLDSNRQSLRRSRSKINKGKTYSDGDLVGKSHKLRVISGVQEAIKLRGLDIIVTINNRTLDSRKDQLIRDGIAKALRKEANAYLPRRLSHLAEQAGFHYERIRFTHAKSRWGSCSSSGTISLNIMLMTLPNDLIDYVLLHELTHTKYMNHSVHFWQSLEVVCPGAKQKKRLIKQHSPYL